MKTKRTMIFAVVPALLLAAAVLAGCDTGTGAGNGNGNGKHAAYGSPLYTGEVSGTASGAHAGGTATVVIALTLVDGYITAVDFEGSSGNTAGFGSNVLTDAKKNEIITKNSVEIDAVTNASITRNALVKAGKQALNTIPGVNLE
jgi:predicted small secreted protein